MVGSIDPDASKSVGPIGRTQVAWLIGTRIAETILASGQTHRINRPDIWTQAIRSPIKKLLCHGGRPHIWVPAFAGTTKLNRACIALHTARATMRPNKT